MAFWNKKKGAPQGTGLVQLRGEQTHPFRAMEGYMPLHPGEIALYRTIREAVPVVDAAIIKLIRLCGGVEARCPDSRAEGALNRFLRRVPTGRGQRGVQSFLDCYLDSMLTCGRGVGEIVPTADGRDIAALLCADAACLEIREGESPLDVTFCARGPLGQITPLPRQDLILFTPFMPETDSPYGVSLLRSMPFLAGILLKIFQATGMNWERMGNVRFAVVCKPDKEGNYTQERCESVAREWSQAMAQAHSGRVRDFVAAGDIDIKVIGADNQILDSEIPVRQILEQLVAKTGIPPFLLGLSWSTTERMSTQQADMMTSEITAIRRSVEPVLERVCEQWLTLHGYGPQVEMAWSDINLQDQVEEARAALYYQQARAVELENAAAGQE